MPSMSAEESIPSLDGGSTRNTLDSARIPRASKLLICGLFQKGRVLAQDGVYLSAVEDAFGADIDYAMLVKHYGNAPEG